MDAVDKMSQEQMESAAEAARKRREARRRRILADPDERMKRITGYNQNSTGESQMREGDVKLRPYRVREPPPTGEDNIPTYPTEHTVVSAPAQVRAEETLQRVASIKRRPLQVIDTTDLQETSSVHRLRLADSTSSLVSRDIQGQSAFEEHTSTLNSNTEQSQEKTEEEHHIINRSTGNSETNRESQSIRDSAPTLVSEPGDAQEITVEEQTKDNLGFTRRRYLICILLGVIIRLSFMYDFGNVYVQSIINPFVAFEVACIGYQKGVGMDLGGSVQGGIWLSILMLCGIKRELINTYKTIMGVIASVTDDFIIYFFAFVLVHIFL